jgi:hypothetical protein
LSLVSELLIARPLLVYNSDRRQDRGERRIWVVSGRRLFERPVE